MSRSVLLFGSALLLGALSFGPHLDAQSRSCTALEKFAASGTTIERAEDVPAGSAAATMRQAPPFLANLQIPAFCEVRGIIHARRGADGASYAINFELRLPASWNGKFLFQGGGGLDGVVQPAIGFAGAGPPALARGYAVVSTDGGHQGATNTAFGREQQARLDYAYAAIGTVTQVAKAMMVAYYGKPEQHSYFVGCSNGGREAMIAVQRYPLDFDGAVAGDPGFDLSHAAIGEAWDSEAFLSIAPHGADGQPILSEAFSNADLKLVSDAVLNKCDRLDGLADGEVNNIRACKFDPAVLTCHGAKTAACLSRKQVDVLQRVFNGAHDSAGHPIYASWPYDAGIAGPDWRNWKLGTSSTSASNAVNATMGSGALKDYFVHPYIAGLDPLHVDFDTISGQVQATHAINDAVSTDLGTFAARGGRLVIYEGQSDPVFSANDLIAYYDRFAQDSGGMQKAQSVARLFLVPGMNHCQGGPSTDRFDSLTALEQWVEKDQAPASISASGKAFPGRTRPLCPYPAYAAYKGSGDPQEASSFSCVQ